MGFPLARQLASALRSSVQLTDTLVRPPERRLLTRWRLLVTGGLGLATTGEPGTFWRINDAAYLLLDGGHAGRRRHRPGRAGGARPARTRRALPEVRQS